MPLTFQVPMAIWLPWMADPVVRLAKQQYNNVPALAISASLMGPDLSASPKAFHFGTGSVDFRYSVSIAVRQSSMSALLALIVANSPTFRPSSIPMWYHFHLTGKRRVLTSLRSLTVSLIVTQPKIDCIIAASLGLSLLRVGGKVPDYVAACIVSN